VIGFIAVEKGRKPLFRRVSHKTATGGRLQCPLAFDAPKDEVRPRNHWRRQRYYPQSNGKIERWHKSLKGECIRPGTPLSLEDARGLVKG
jgi:transposase InsO family protein